MNIDPKWIDYVVHLDNHLGNIIENYGIWSYLILFSFVFIEEGFAFTPFMPGESFLFFIGALGAARALNFTLALILLMAASVIGNLINYSFGKMIGEKLLKNSKLKLINQIFNKEYFEKTDPLYKKYGGMAILLLRLLPILRTLEPFAAGVKKIDFTEFAINNSIGAVGWVLIYMTGGYFWGSIPAFKDDFTYVILGIMLLSLLTFIIAIIVKGSKRKTGGS